MSYYKTLFHNSFLLAIFFMIKQAFPLASNGKKAERNRTNLPHGT